MTIPDPGPTPPPAVVGTQPRNADEVNGLVGLHLNAVLSTRVLIGQDQNWLLATDLKVAPYSFTPDQETLIKSAYTTANDGLQAIDLTFISRVVGMSRLPTA